ncbi:MAG TPA: hypothetical protein VGX68_09740 [Thermoanaerobaculia bacterium]|jgi:hypothetical protein|nr:hypothetical protein [Thermoanaerobaculia bacterium]
MQLGESLDQEESQSQTAAATVQAAFGLAERLEDPGEQLRVHADAGVAHGDGGVSALRLLPRFDRDPPTALGELDGIVHHITDHLREPGGIAGHPGG